jgi:20S proteasome alpha/beta subunit
MIASTMLPKMVAAIVLFLYLTSGSVMSAQDDRKISRGTVNIALANANGIILLTDSVQSHKEQDGWHYVQPVQKLFRLDDKTVCSFAGFASETGWFLPQLNTEIPGVIADFQDQLSKHPVSQLEAKLQAIGHLVGFYIDLIANRREVVVGPGTPIDSYIFEVIVAGYDADGKPKLEKLVITPVVVQAADGHNYWSHTTSPEVANVGRKLAALLGGIQVVSHEVLNSPQKFGDSGVVGRYMRAKKHDGGESLTLDDMAALASYMAAQTARKTPAVGGPDQIVFLAKGSILKFKQPPLPGPPRPLKFTLMVGLRVTGALPLEPVPGGHLLWIRSKFIGIRNPRLRLDSQFFYGCEIRDSIVEYGGGLTDFGTTNTVVNSMILPGYPVASTTEMLRMMNGFNWTQDPPNTPPLPVTIGPL